MRSTNVSFLSAALTTVVIANAYYQKKQFYPSVVYITKSNPSMAVIYVQAFIFVWLVGKLMRKIFFGQLRTAEFEHLMERSWYAITETCLAFTVFRDDFNPKFVALFTLLLFLKSFHWLAEDRVDYMERSPMISWIFHARVSFLLLLLGSLDFYFIQHAYQSTVSKGASVQLVFGFEYAILLTIVVNIAVKYALHSIDLNSETPWENKAVFLLYTEVVIGLLKVILYVSFVAIMVRIYTLPLFAFRPMYYTIRNFKKAFTDVILSRRAIHNMNTLYPDATAEELQAADSVCIICREEMVTASKKLPCNHIFHTSCLRSWFQRQQTCPTCRLNILNVNTNTRNEPQNIQMPANQANVFFNLNAQNQFRLFNQLNAAEAPRGTNNERANTERNPLHQGNFPAFSFPPFPFLPFMTPPPTQPHNFSNLTNEELRRMEGNERENIEARIQCLRNIQTMLDAAVIMMQQYSAATALSLQVPSSSDSNNSPENTSNKDDKNASVSKETSSHVGDCSPTKNSSSSKSEAASAENVSLPDSCKENESLVESSSPDEELRRRRLQKFEQKSDI